VWRETELWTYDVNEMLSANLEAIRKVYASFLFGLKKCMNKDDCINLMVKDTEVNLGVA